MWLCDQVTKCYRKRIDWSWFLSPEPSDLPITVSWPFSEEGEFLWEQWMDTNGIEDASISGVLADWLDDHRDSLLEGAVGQDPKGRLDLLIRWLREVRCWGKESVSA